MEIALFSPLSHSSQLHIAHFLTLSCQVGSFLWPEDDHTWFSSCLLTYIPLGFTCTLNIIVISDCHKLIQMLPGALLHLKQVLL